MPTISAAQQVGSCGPGSARALLEANNVRAAVYNAGNLFWAGSGNTYTVPKTGRADAMFAANLWIGGLVDGELRFAGSDYGPFEFFPGPLTENGELSNPSDCSAYDRIYGITRRDLDRLDETGEATDDILEWPWQNGAPVADGDGNPDNYDLAAGDRPDLTGHQMLWWVMNDLGGSHRWSESPPLGIEVRVSAFSVLSTDPALDNATFYRYRITNPQSYDIDSAYVGLWMDPDLGNATDDFMGSDTTLGLAFVYNGDDYDETTNELRPGYGERPPAIGIDFVQGPRAEKDGEDNDGDGLVDEEGERREMSAFVQYYGDSSPQGNPEGAEQAYGYMQAVWRDGKHVTLGGTGYGGPTPINFMYPGDPVTRAFWSEEDTDSRGSRNTPSDGRSIASAGPFLLKSGEAEEIVIAVVWARGSDRLDSVAELRESDERVQSAWTSNTLDDVLLPDLDKSAVLLSPADEVAGQPLQLTLRWEPVKHAMYYDVDLAESSSFTDGSVQTVRTRDTWLDLDSLSAFTDHYWRVRMMSAVSALPTSQVRRFVTADVLWPSPEVGVQTVPGSNRPAFLEIQGPGGIDPCTPEAQSRYGCDEAGGNFVYTSYNSTGEYVLYHDGAGPQESLPTFVPNDYDIRFTAEGSYAVYWFGSKRVIPVPFEVWDVGSVELFNENDPSDDVQLIPVLVSQDGSECDFGYGEAGDPFGLGWKVSDAINAYYPAATYADWEAKVGPLVKSADDQCYQGDATLEPLIDTDRSRPLQGITFSGEPAHGRAPGEGTLVRFYTTPSLNRPPAPAAPGDGSGPLDQPIHFYWNGPRGTYQIQISDGPNFDVPIIDHTVDSDSHVISGLTEGETFWWRVRPRQLDTLWSDVWTFTAGTVTNVGAGRLSELPEALTLEQNYPNPSNPSTTIRFGLPEAGPARLLVYDLLGRRVDILVEGTLSAGWHEVVWNASQHASGVYVYTLEANGRRLSNSLVVVR